MLKKILAVSLLFLLFFLVFKDRLLKSGISFLLSKKFSLETDIKKAQLNFDGIVLEGLSLGRGELSLNSEELSANFNLFSWGIDDLKISDCKLQFKDINASLVLEKSSSGLYILDLLSLEFKDREIKSISIPLALDAGKISFNRLDSDFFGNSAGVSGILNYQDTNNICLKLNFKDTSFENAINLFSKEEDFTLAGDFDGELELCLTEGKMSKIYGYFYNANGGVINIKKGTSLAFLERYLDQASYDALVDNFKHYAYNKGRIKITREEGVVALNLDFGSDDLGRRNISFNLHGILGGRE